MISNTSEPSTPVTPQLSRSIGKISKAERHERLRRILEDAGELLRNDARLKLAPTQQLEDLRHILGSSS